jgi:hypothetical protein
MTGASQTKYSPSSEGKGRNDHLFHRPGYGWQETGNYKAQPMLLMTKRYTAIELHGKKVLGRIVVDCPHCGERHRFSLDKAGTWQRLPCGRLGGATIRLSQSA